MRFYYRLVAGRGGVLVLGTLEAWVGRGAAGIGVGCRGIQRRGNPGCGRLGRHDCIAQPGVVLVTVVVPMPGQVV